MENNIIILSYIMPVYNGAKHIRNTISSVLNQPGDNYELIIINDGSKDNSDQIIKEYYKDTHVKYIKTDNFGVSHARNIGIENANGLYLIFLDQDDIIIDGAFNSWLERELLSANNKKIDSIGFLNVFSNKDFTKFRFKEQAVESKSTNGKTFMLVGCPIHFAFYNRYLFQTCSIRCFEMISNMDTDINFTHLLFYKSRNTELRNDIVFYCWRNNPQSVSSTILDKNIAQKYINILSCWKDIYFEHKTNNEIDVLPYCHEMICNIFAQTLYFYHWLYFRKASWENGLYDEYVGFIADYKKIYNKATIKLLDDYLYFNFLFRLKARMYYHIRRLLLPIKRTTYYENKKYPLNYNELPKYIPIISKAVSNIEEN